MPAVAQCIRAPAIRTPYSRFPKYYLGSLPVPPERFPTPSHHHGIRMNRLKRWIKSVLLFGSLALFGYAALAQQTPPLACDADNNGVIDIRDLTLIAAARNTAASGPTDPRDPNRDGVINVLDGRFCATICTLSSCAKVPSPPPPVANSGADQQVAVGATVELNGSASTSARGDALTYKWSLVSVPSGSTALLANPTAVRPTFVADLNGIYDVDLVVTDAHGVVSVAGSTLIGAGNATVPPVANAGAGTYPTATVGGPVTLNAAQSTSVSGAQLIDEWQFVFTPSNSSASLSYLSSVNSTFTPDVPGQYYLQLQVLDSNYNSSTANVTIDTQAHTPQAPTANAGPALWTVAGQTLALSGLSSTAPAGETISGYQWTLLTKPAASTTQLSNPNSAGPTLRIDTAGDYVVQLMVTANGATSSPTTVLISTSDVPPVASAGIAQTVYAGDTVYLHGTGSAPDGNPLTFRWSVIDSPEGWAPISVAGGTTASPNFATSYAGTYVAQLIVNNGHVDSTPSVTVITANTPTTADLSLAQTVSSTTPLIGANIQFTITLTNLGPLATTSASVTDLLPAGLQFVSALPTQGSFNSASGVWTVGPVQRNGTAQLVLTAVATTTSTQTNTATITASAPIDPIAANNVASTVVTPVQVANLTIVTTINNSTPLVGSNVVFTTTVTNNGPAAATGVQVSDLLPSGFAVISGLPSAGSYNTGTGVWTIGGLANGATVTLTVTATVLSTGTYTDTASVNATNSLNSGANVTATIAVAPVVPATVSITAPVGGTTYYAPASFTVSVAASITTGQITQVVLYDGAVAVQTQQVNAGSAALNFGLSGVAVGTHIYTAVATYGQGYTTSSTPVSIIVANAQTANLSVVTKVSNLTPAVGSSIVFTTTVTNSGPAAATAAQVADLLPSGFAFVSAQAGAGSYSAGSGVWTIGTLANGATATLTVTATVLATGSYTDSAAVTATNLLSGDANATSAVTVVPQTPPTVSITSPVTGTSYIAPASINLAVAASSTSGIIAQLAVYDGTALVQTAAVNLPSVNITFSFGGVAAGTHVYTVVATDGHGLTATSNVVTIVVIAPTATGALLAPANNSFYVAPATVVLIANASSSTGTLSRVEFFQGGTSLGVVSGPPYQLAVTGLAVGSYSFTVAITDATSTVASTPATVTVIAAPTVTLTSPSNGASITDSVVTVSGSVQSPPNSAISVNGVVGTIAPDGTFFASNVPLTTGSNPLIFSVTTPDNQTATQGITVTSAGPPPVEVDTSTNSGLAPLNVHFNMFDRTSTAVTQVNISCTGNGTVDISTTAIDTTGLSNDLGACGYSSAGYYHPTVSVIGSSGQTLYTSTQTVYVVAPTDLELTVRSVYVGMLGRLTAGDVTGALNAVTGSAYPKYSAVFNSLSNLPSVISQLGTIQQATVTDGVAEYLLLRNSSGGQVSFLLYLMRGEDGIWRIDGM